MPGNSCQNLLKTKLRWFLVLLWQHKVARDKGISKTKSEQQSPCSKCMHWPVMSWGNPCSTCMYLPVMCMHWPMTSQADACIYCMGSKASSLCQIYLTQWQWQTELILFIVTSPKEPRQVQLWQLRPRFCWLTFGNGKGSTKTVFLVVVCDPSMNKLWVTFTHRDLCIDLSSLLTVNS